MAGRRRAEARLRPGAFSGGGVERHVPAGHKAEAGWLVRGSPSESTAPCPTAAAVLLART